MDEEAWQKYQKRPLTGFVKMWGTPNKRVSEHHRLKVIFQRADGMQAVCTMPRVAATRYANDKKRAEAIKELKAMLPEIPEDAVPVFDYLQTPGGWYRVIDGKLHFKAYTP